MRLCALGRGKHRTAVRSAGTVLALPGATSAAAVPCGGVAPPLAGLRTTPPALQCLLRCAFFPLETARSVVLAARFFAQLCPGASRGAAVQALAPALLRHLAMGAGLPGVPGFSLLGGHLVPWAHCDFLGTAPVFTWLPPAVQKVLALAFAWVAPWFAGAQKGCWVAQLELALQLQPSPFPPCLGSTRHKLARGLLVSGGAWQRRCLMQRPASHAACSNLLTRPV